MRFAIWEHAGKGGYLRQCLLAQGHTSADTIDGTDLLLADCDWHWAHPRPELISAAHKAGAKIALFPHGGQPTVFIYDGLTTPDPHVDLRLEHGPGSIQIAQELGLDLKQQAPGWLYSPTQPFEPVEKPVRVLFAPQHPNMEALERGTNGHDPAPRINQTVHRQLLQLGYEVSVIYVGPLWRNGIWPHPRARLVQNHEMAFHLSYLEVMGADVVVGAGTIAATAIACGKPTVMLGQGNYADYIDGAYVHPDREHVYADRLRYPLDVGDGDLDDLILRACAGDPAAAAWRADYISDDGTTQATRLLEELVMVETLEPDPEDENGDEPEQTHVFIDGVTAAAGAAAVGEESDE